MNSVEDITILKDKIRPLLDMINQCLEDSELIMNILTELKKSSQHKDQLYFMNEAYEYAVTLKNGCNTVLNYINSILRDLIFLDRMLTKNVAH